MSRVIEAVRVLGAVGTAALLLIASGCGGGGGDASESSGAVTTTVTSSETTIEKPDVATGSEAVAFVEQYYDLIDTHRFHRAWPYLPKSVQQQSGGYDEWRAGYGANVSTTMGDAELASKKGTSAVVSVSLSSKDKNSCGGTVKQMFAGDWTLSAAGADWEADDIDIAKTGGGDPSLATDCPPDDSTTTTTQQSNCTPGYSPCLKPSSDYDCAGGSGDGPSYANGPISVSGSDPYDLDSDGDGVGCE